MGKVDARGWAARLDREVDLRRRAARTAVARATRDGEKALEAATARGGLKRLSRAWASETFPRAGRLSDRPRGIVFVRGVSAERALHAFTTGVTIKGKRGNYLWWPTNYNQKGGRRNSGEPRITTAEMAREPTAFVLPSKARRREVLLWCLPVLEASRRGKGRAPTRLAYAAGRFEVGGGRRKRVTPLLGQGFVPMFIGMKTVTLAKLFDRDAVVRPAQADLAETIVEITRLAQKSLSGTL